MKREYSYKDYTDDVVQVAGQDFRLPEDYEWVRTDVWYRVCSFLLYGIIRGVAWIYCRLVLGVHIHGGWLLDNEEGGIMLVGNHTQEVGDAFIPVVANRRRINTIISPANLKVPVLGPMLRMIGGLAIPDGIRQMGRFGESIAYRARQGHCIVVYPEAHVWPYYTKLRPFPSTSFRYSVENNLPVFTMTTTYRKPRHGSKPRIDVWIDGPVSDLPSGSAKERRETLCRNARRQMEQRCASSNYEYCTYTRIDD